MTKTFGIVAAALAAGAVLLMSASQASAALPLTVTLGASCPTSKVTGFTGNFPGGVTGAMRQFLGIPYAKPPIGDKRWRPPEPLCWNGTTKITNVFGKSCPQGPTFDAWESEDCLSLNIFAPATGNYSNLPVMVWIHGGGLTSGGSSFFANPLDLVNKGVIVVSINYRIGALGFLAHKAIDNKTTKSTGNYGLQDQIAALQWVKANIAKFGGNAANVTVFGGSAGGVSIEVLLVSPLTTGLFHKAILQSSAGGSPTVLATAQGTGQTFAAAAGCSTAACLRKLSVAKILANQALLGQSTPLVKIDNVVLLQTKPLNGANFKKIPIIKGTTHDESRFHLAGNPRVGTGTACNFTSNVTASNYINSLQNNGFGPMTFAQTVAGIYWPGGGATAALAAALTDRNFVCPAQRISKAFAKAGGKIYVYEFNEQKSPTFMNNPVKLAEGGGPLSMGAYHGADGQFIFRLSNGMCGPYPGLSAAQKALAAKMVTYWTTFAKTGRPAATETEWPLYKATGKLMSLAATSKLITATAFNTDHKCAFWDANP